MNGKQYTFNRAFLCTVTNHPYFGGGVSIMPTANPRKAVVDLVVVERINIFKILWLIFLLLRQKQGKSKHFHHFQSSKIRIVSTIPQTIHADGEILGKRSIDMVYTTQKRLFYCCVIYLNPNIFLNFATDLHLYSKINFLILKN